VWIKVGVAGGKSTYIVIAYLPCSKGIKHRRSVFQQHGRQLKSILGDLRNPRTVFIEHLSNQIKKWKAEGSEVVLYTDANENIYTDRLAEVLTSDDINMTEQFQAVTGEQAPASHNTGKRPITGLFTTAGIKVTNIYMSPHGAGLGDHRYCVYDIDAASVLGSSFPAIHKPAPRLLRMEVKCNVRKFNRVMEQLVDQHRMYHKLSKINSLAARAPSQVVKQAFNKWDDELTNYMKSAESKGCKLFRGKCEYSPLLGYWYGRKRLWDRARRHKLEPLRDPRNLYRDLSLHNFPRPNAMTLEFIDAKILACENELSSLEAQATHLRQQHLQERLRIARKREDKDAVTAIVRIIRKERYDELRG
jgi:hypothetical protein